MVRGPIVVSSAIYEGLYRLSGCCSSLSVVVCRMVVSSTTRGAIQALRVLLKSLGGRMGSYGGLQYHARDYTDTQESGCCSMVTEWF